MTFEGNTEGIHGSTEQRMSKIFGGRIKGEPPKSTSRILSGDSKIIAGTPVPSKPVEPDNCCMSGCVNCVWEMFSEDLRDWRRKRRIAAERIKGTDEIWPAHWSPPLPLLDLQNIPKSLRKEKINQDKHRQESNSKSPASIFPKRTEPLPKTVLEAKARNAHLKKGASGEPDVNKSEKNELLEDDQEGWNDIPVYIKAFAEFERKKKLMKRNKI